MKEFIFAALLTLTSIPVFADGVSCPEMAKTIADYEREKKAGGLSKVRAESIKGILSASYKSYKTSGCKDADLHKYKK